MNEAGIVRVDALSRLFPPGVLAVDNIDLSIQPGEFVAITGSSGSGKSTLLNILGLLDRPTGGRYWFEGVDTTGLSDKALTLLRSRSIGFVFQTFQLVSHLTVAENVILGLTYARVPPNRRLERALEALQAVGMQHRLAAQPRTLSGGELQRVAIARAVARAPRLLLCDEPTGNLDSTNTGIVLDLLETTHRSDRALVVVTHDAEVAARARRVLRMHDGRVVSGRASH